MIELRRAPLVESLEHLAEGGHLLVVGEPGAGKSWLLKEFVCRLRDRGDGVIFLRAEDHAVASLGDLYKSIGVADFVAALRGYSGQRKFLVIDSLDSLRAEVSQRAFRDLIRIVQTEVPAFTIVVSIRTFDMQRSPELQQLFPQNDAASFSAQGYSARHLTVDVFSELEIDEAIAQDERLRPVLNVASEDAKTLLRNPFNLWLVIHLMDVGAPVNWLSTIQSEVQLLDQYWLHRIDHRDDGVSRNALLKIVTQRMVDSRMISVALRDFAPSEISDGSLTNLLRDEILIKSESGRISYAHNILFDFAISKLLIDELNVMTFVLSSPARGIFYRPSISYLMARFWFRDRALFWKTVERFFERRATTPGVVAITAAKAMCDLAQTIADLASLFELSSETRIRVIVFLLRAIQALDGLNGEKRYVWIAFLVESLSYVDKQFLNEAIALIEVALRGTASATEVQLLTLVAVKYLRWIWSKAETEADISDARSLADFAAARLIPIVAKNYSATPAVAKAILTEVLGRFKNPRSSANEAFRVASNLDSVIENDPELASDIYITILGHDESSDEETRLGGAVLPLLSRRSQDFSLSYYVLGVTFTKLAVRDAVIAARTAARAVTAEVKRREGDAVNTLRAYGWTFQFLGKQMTLNSDRSEIWDHHHKDYPAIQLVDQLLYHIKSHLESGDLSRDDARHILCELGQANEFAVTWKRILTYASHTPEFLTIIPDLLRVPELLVAPETTEGASAAIRKAYEKDLFGREDFIGIQKAILAIPELPLAAIFREPLDVRDSLLACIPLERREIDVVAALGRRKADSGTHAPTGVVQVGPGYSGPDEEDGWLKRQGVETERPDNQALLTATRILKSFESRFASQAEMPSKEDADSINEMLWNTYQLVQQSPTADERVVTDALTATAAVAKNILRNREFTEEDDVIAKCKAILAVAAAYPLPLPREDADSNFDRPAWSPTPKIEAAQGVMNYLGNWGTDEQMKSLAVTLSADGSPAVRLQIAISLTCLYENNRDSFWNIANGRLRVENAVGVLASLAHSVTHPYIAKRERKAVIDWQTELLGRKLPSGRIEEVLKTVAHSLTDLYVFFGDADSSEALKIFERTPAEYTKELAQIVVSATFYLSDGIGGDNDAKSEIRVRAREIWARALRCADAVISEYFNTPTPDSADEFEREQQRLKGALTIIDSAVFQLYLLFRVNEHLVRENLPPLNDPQRQKLFKDLDPIWELLLGPIGPQHKGLLPAQTTHHLVELFRTTVPYDPPRVLQLTANLFKGFNMGYQSDQMAITEVVRFAEIILADHKDILKEPTHAANLAFILDQFVEFGWPQATRLLMKLDNAVR